jgi:hypothetical protein
MHAQEALELVLELDGGADPDVQNSRIRFFMDKVRSHRPPPGCRAPVGEAPGRRWFDHPGKAGGREWRARTACTHAAMIAREVSFGVARGVRMTEFPFTDCAIAGRLEG